ncbi:MAG: CvpA family protein [Clostridiales bacterium]|nr:CvpA family protein [Clostridiales bacterium]
MNSVCIIIGVFFLLCIFVNWARGLFKALLSVAGLIASIAVAVYAAPHLSGYLEENTQVDEKIAAYVAERLEYSEVGEEVSRSVQVAIIQELPLPETLKAGILDNNNSEMYHLLEVGGVYDYIAKSVAVVILNVTVFLGLTILCRLLFFVLSRTVKDLTKLPIVRWIDKIGGGCLGALKGLIYIWVFFLMLSICSTFEWSQYIIEQISELQILKLLYDNNILLDIVGDLTSILFR